VVRETPVPTTVRRREGGANERPALQDQRGAGTQAPRLSPETKSAQPHGQSPVVSQPAPRTTAPAPVVPETRRAPEPTGREQPRIYPGNPAETRPAPARPAQSAPIQPVPAPKRENVERPATPPAPVERPPAAAPERPTNPTGKERGYERNQPPAAPPAQHPPEPRPGRPEGPPPEQQKERDKDKDHP
jgi:hypothetical protein